MIFLRPFYILINADVIAVPWITSVCLFFALSLRLFLPWTYPYIVGYRYPSYNGFVRRAQNISSLLCGLWLSDRAFHLAKSIPIIHFLAGN